MKKFNMQKHFFSDKVLAKHAHQWHNWHEIKSNKRIGQSKIIYFAATQEEKNISRPSTKRWRGADVPFIYFSRAQFALM
jgi:hypothetical protein